jgi:hypothetical protein
MWLMRGFFLTLPAELEESATHQARRLTPTRLFRQMK